MPRIDWRGLGLSFGKRFGKAIASILVAVLVTIYGFTSGDNHLDLAEKVFIIGAFLGAVATYLTPLVPQWPWAKTAVYSSTAAANLLATFVIQGVDMSEWVLVLLTLLGAGAVAVAPAVSQIKTSINHTEVVVAPWGSDSGTITQTAVRAVDAEGDRDPFTPPL